MNTSPVKLGAIPLLLSLATFTAVRTAHSQSTDAPPVKMGLWETESTAKTTGMENTPMARAGNRTTVSQGCLTPETWKSGLEHMQNDAQRSDCKVSKMQQDSHSLSFDETCNSERYNSDVHFEALIDDSEHIHGSGKVHITAPGLPQPMTMDMSLKSHYVSASCGDVKPGEGKIIRHE
jgi:hypothetical protein